MLYYYYYYYFLIYSLLLITRWQSSSKSRSQQQIKAVYRSTSRIMCAVLISVIFCSSMADWWPGSNWRFWSEHLSTVPNAPVITGTIFAFTFHILLTSITSLCTWLLSQFLFFFNLNHLILLYRSADSKSSHFYHAVIYQGCLLVLFYYYHFYCGFFVVIVNLVIVQFSLLCLGLPTD